MSWQDDLLNVMDSRAGTGSRIKLAVMTGPNSCKVGNMSLNAEDLLIAEHLTHSVCVAVSQIAPEGGGKCTDKSVYAPGLKAGDIVTVYQYSDSKYLVLERMVNG